MLMIIINMYYKITIHYHNQSIIINGDLNQPPSSSSSVVLGPKPENSHVSHLFRCFCCLLTNLFRKRKLFPHARPVGHFSLGRASACHTKLESLGACNRALIIWSQCFFWWRLTQVQYWCEHIWSVVKYFQQALFRCKCKYLKCRAVEDTEASIFLFCISIGATTGAGGCQHSFS